LFLIILCFGTLFGLGAFFLSAGLLKLPTSASTRAVMTVTSRKKESKSLDAIVMDMAFKVSKLVRISDFKRRKLESTLKSADISMTPEVYIAKAWVKAALIGLLIIPLLLIFPLLAPVILFLAIAVYFREMKQADEIVKVKREEIEYELPRFVGTISQELRASRDVLSIMKAYQQNAGPTMKRELEITIADMASGNEETALTRFETRIGSTMLSDVIRGLIAVKRGDNGTVYFQMLAITFKQLEVQRLKLEAMKKPGKMKKYSFFLLGCFLLMYLGILGYEVVNAFSKMF
jgi:Flp pilus assembly protein TadB